MKKRLWLILEWTYALATFWNFYYAIIIDKRQPIIGLAIILLLFAFLRLQHVYKTLKKKEEPKKEPLITFKGKNYYEE